MSGKAEKLQDAIGLVSDEYILEAHGEGAEGADAGTGSVAAGAEAEAAVKPVTNEESKTAGAKVIEMPVQRKRKRAAAPIAIAACLVLALGVGALAFTQMAKAPVEEAATTADVTDAKRDAEAESVSLMTTESAADGAAAGAAETGRGASDLAPGQSTFPQVEGEAFVLTAAEWNDNGSWPFFMNLVNSHTISFPTFGLDPTHRVKATIVDAAGNPVRGEGVVLVSGSGDELWHATSGKDGAAYLFYREGQDPSKVVAGGVEQYVGIAVVDAEGQQDEPMIEPADDVTIEVGTASATPDGLQVMFIVDTTGSMSDEIAYLQKDFASIAGDVGASGIEYSVNFYRDEGDAYVTKCNGFTSDVAQVQALLNAEYAEGGGDAPEAVADILAATITDNGAWRDGASKIAFLIFDAPPHDGTDAVLDAAVRSAAERGIRLVPVVASNADRETELFGRALAIMTGATYVFLTDDSGVGESHLEPIVGDYTVELLHDVIVRLIEDAR